MSVRLLGAVLAGGRSQRFGSDKAVALFDGRRLIDRVMSVLRAQVDDLVVCGREMPGVACIPDPPGPGLGPLGGIAAALRHGAEHGFDAVVSVPCDTPDLPGDLVTRLSGGGACYAVECPVIGYWPVTLADLLERHIATSPDRSLRAWVRRAEAEPVAMGTIWNVNTVADLEMRVRETS